MKKIDLVFGLHLYQPPTQKRETLHKIAQECYGPLCDFVAKTNAHLTIDIAKSLLELLEEETPDIASRLKYLVGHEKIFLVNTAAYHPILPLVPKSFIKRQLLLNEDAYRDSLGVVKKCSGIFPPEMAFSPKILQPLKDLGYRWTVTDEIGFTTHYNCDAPLDWIPMQNGVACFLRSRSWSNQISWGMPNGAMFTKWLWEYFDDRFPNFERIYLILWMDGETFGHHHKEGFAKFLKPFIETHDQFAIKIVSPDELLSIYPAQNIDMPECSWSTEWYHVRSGTPYPLWRNRHEQWHTKWWELSSLVLKIARKHPEVQPVCDRALYSCQTWWWANQRDAQLFLWTIPDFLAILNAGTPEQREQGNRLIEIIKTLR